MSQSLLERASGGVGSPLIEGPDPADQAADLMDKGIKHFIFKDLDKKRSDLEKALGKAKKELDGQRKIGMGETEAIALLKVVVVPAFKAYHESLTKITAAVDKVANTPSRF